MVAKQVVIAKMILSAALCLVLAACSLGMDEALGRVASDPFPEIPSVRSFNGDWSIDISWTKDEAADEYYLYRAADTPHPEYELIYRGLLTDYKDVFELTSADKPFLYRLGKKRGDKFFVDFTAPGKAGFGIVSGHVRDTQEHNNTRETAAHLGASTLEVNSWFYRSNTNDAISLYDEDWYYVVIPAHWEAVVVLTDLDVPEYTSTNHFVIEQWGLGSGQVESENGLSLHNTGNKEARFYIRISPDTRAFGPEDGDSDPFLGSGGFGKFIRYTITVSQLVREKS